MSDLKESLQQLTKEQLIELLEMASKNLVAMDGVWFQVLEERDGMDRAMEIDAEVWNRYPISEAKRLKKFLGLDEHPGLQGLAQAIALNYNVHANEASMFWEDNALIFRIDVFRRHAAERAWTITLASPWASTNTLHLPRRSTAASRLNA